MSSPTLDLRITGTQVLTLDVILGDGPLAPVWEIRERHDTARGPVWDVSRMPTGRR